MTKADRLDELLCGLLTLIEDIERALIVKRITDGIARAQSEGKHFGRPLRVFRRDKAKEMRAKGMSLRTIARALDVPLTTVATALRVRSSKAAR
jgi:DNA invertase Pin-like site-specific DNA recombinase